MLTPADCSSSRRRALRSRTWSACSPHRRPRWHLATRPRTWIACSRPQAVTRRKMSRRVLSVPVCSFCQPGRSVFAAHLCGHRAILVIIVKLWVQELAPSLGAERGGRGGITRRPDTGHDCSSQHERRRTTAPRRSCRGRRRAPAPGSRRPTPRSGARGRRVPTFRGPQCGSSQAHVDYSPLP